MSTEFISEVDDPTQKGAGPSTGSWSTHKSGDAEGSFPDMDVDADLDRVSVIESLCMNCHEQGLTKLLLTRIPYFRDIVVMSFECPHCNVRSAEVQPANDLALKAVRTTLTVDISNIAATKADLNRQVIKSETCRVLIPEADFEIPANGTRGDINTIEGVLTNIADSLQAEQGNRELGEPERAAKIQAVIEEFRLYASGAKSFTFILDDLAGNSFLENPTAPAADPRVQTKYYERTNEQTLELGYSVEENKNAIENLPVLKGEEAARKMKELMSKKSASSSSSSSSSSSEEYSKNGMPHEVTGRGVTVAPEALARIDTYFNVSDRSAVMSGPCNNCNADCETRMCVTDVPHFKDVVLLVTSCDSCGFRDAEVKPMGQVSAKGRRITLRVTSVEDLKRDILKSDTASCSIPELELELEAGTLGGKYTTLEGMIEDIRTQLTQFNPFALGDSSEAAQKNAMTSFITRLTDLPEVKTPWTFVLDDPLGNVFIFSPLGEQDPNIVTERYERTFAQNEELGLNDINVDNYQTEEQKEELRLEMEREHAQKEIEKAMEQAMIDGSSSSSVEYGDKTEAQHAADNKAQMIELKKGKIGGNISVEHDVDDTSVTHQPATNVIPVVSAAAASSSSSSSSSSSAQ